MYDGEKLIGRVRDNAASTVRCVGRATVPLRPGGSFVPEGYVESLPPRLLPTLEFLAMKDALAQDALLVVAVLSALLSGLQNPSAHTQASGPEALPCNVVDRGGHCAHTSRASSSSRNA